MLAILPLSDTAFFLTRYLHLRLEPTPQSHRSRINQRLNRFNNSGAL